MYYYFLILLLIFFVLFLYYNFYSNIKNKVIVTKNLEITTPKIPKIIIQTWKTEAIPQRYMELIDSIKKNNPDYEYLFFTDDNIKVFLKTYYPEYYQTYLNLPIKIQRIDFFRYIVVYHFGGFYMDLDMLCLKSFDNLLGYDCIFPVDEFIYTHLRELNRYKPFCEKGYNYLIGQYAFAAVPKHPFIKKIIDTIHKNLNYYVKHVNYTSEEYVYKTTGPDFITSLYINYPDKNEIFILDNGNRQFFGDYAEHKFFGTWK